MVEELFRQDSYLKDADATVTAVEERGVRLDRAVGADVPGRQSALGQRPPDQEAAMAVERLALGAKQANAMLPHRLHHAVETGAKFRPCGHRVVDRGSLT